MLAANKAWYIALNAMLNGDPAPFADVYSRAEDVSYMSAEGGLRLGWGATWSDWKAQTRLAPGRSRRGDRQPRYRQRAVVQTVEKGVVNNREGVGVELVAWETSVFRCEDGKWKMVAHHADLLPNWIEIAGSARGA